MGERKPPGTAWESWVERRIRQARDAGAFDDLEGAGRPIADLGVEYDPLWWVKRWLERQKLSVLPPDLALRKKLETEFEALWRLADPVHVRRRVEELNAEIRRVNASGVATTGRGLAPFDAEEVVEAWRRRRAAGSGTRGVGGDHDDNR